MFCRGGTLLGPGAESEGGKSLLGGRRRERAGEDLCSSGRVKRSSPHTQAQPSGRRLARRVGLGGDALVTARAGPRVRKRHSETQAQTPPLGPCSQGQTEASARSQARC